MKFLIERFKRALESNNSKELESVITDSRNYIFCLEKKEKIKADVKTWLEG